jgi:hypothetical protein
VTPESGGHGTMRGEGYSHHTLLYQNKTHVEDKTQGVGDVLEQKKWKIKVRLGGRAFASRDKKMDVAASHGDVEKNPGDLACGCGGC